MFKKYVKQFLTDESGMELLQLAIVVVITVGLVIHFQWRMLKMTRLNQQLMMQH